MAAVTATPAALEVIERLGAEHGQLVLHQSGGCCDGSAVMCLTADEMPPGPHDLEIGRVGDVPFVIDRDLYERWREPDFALDIAPGAADSFSLEGTLGVHFVSPSVCPVA